jgi:hypothetical protein
MIVEPDFFDHWKTKLLLDDTQIPESPLWVLKLWAHCQRRKKWKFENLEPHAWRAICGAQIDGADVREYLITAGFVEQKGEMFIVHDWEVSNRYLISAWKNGNKGGRPLITDRKPTANHSANRQTTIPSSLSNLLCLSNLKEGVRGRFKEWVEVRAAQGKAPKDWEKMFGEQVNWLNKYPESLQLEILSASIRNNWQGLHEPKGGYQLNGTKPLPLSFQDREKLRQELQDKKNAMFRAGKKDSEEYKQVSKRLEELMPK